MTSAWSKSKQTSNWLYRGYTDILTFNNILLQDTSFNSAVGEVIPQKYEDFQIGGSFPEQWKHGHTDTKH